MTEQDPRLEALRDAYVRDAIELDTFERFVGMIVAGTPVVLPMDCWAEPANPYSRARTLRVLLTPWTDEQLRDTTA